MLRWKSSLKPVSGGGGGSGTNPGTANLVAAYDFDDSGGTGQNDLHTVGPYNLTENGTSAWTTGTPNYYTGATSSDYLTSTGLSAAWASSEQDWSMVVRYKDAQLNRSPYWGAGSREYITFTSGNGHQGRMGASTPITVNTSVSYAGQWVTVYLEYNSSTNKVTIKVLNENLSATSASFTPSWSDGEAIIGGRLGDGGDIDFMYFFSDLLTADEILWFGDNSSIARSYSDLSGATDYRSTVLADNPLFYYRLGESSGTTAYNEVTASSDGTYYNTPTLGQTGAISGDSNTSVLFEEANSESAETVTLTSETSLLPCTIECFIKTSGASDTTAGIVMYRSGSSSASGINQKGSGVPLKLGYHWRDQSNTYGWSGGPTLSDNTWYYVALVVTSTEATFYVIEEDGTLTTAVNTVSHAALDCSNDGWKIARDPNGTRYFQGNLDEVAIYDQALSQSTLVAHAAAAGFTAPNDNFEFTVTTTTSNETFTIPCQNVGTFDATVDWGDGSTSAITAYNDADLVHTYATAGDHDISISGTFPNIRFNNGGDKTKVKSVTNLGSVGWVSFDRAFRGCSNMTSFTAGDSVTSGVSTIQQMFAECSNLATLDLTEFDTSGVTNMREVFYLCGSLTSADLSSFDTTSVTSAMDNFFRNCSSITSIDVTSFDTSGVTNMSNMFRGCSSLTSLDVSSFDTSSATGMALMFRDCSSLTSLDVSSFDTSSVTTMLGMFNSCSSLTSLDVSSFNTSSVTIMTNMFKSMGGGTAQITITGIEDFDITAVNENNMTSFMASTGGLSTTVYDELLVNWQGQTGYNTQNPNFGSSKYTASSAAATARAALVTAGWTITDGGTA